MNKEKSVDQQGMNITLPIYIKYEVLQDHLQKKLKGEVLHKESDKGRITNYAEVLNIELKKSQLPDFDLLVTMKLKTLTFFYRNRELDIDINAKLDFDNNQQKISIAHFEIDSKGGSWIADQVLESVINKFMYGKLKKKLSFDLMPQINEQLSSLNHKLAIGFEPNKALQINGAVDHLKIEDLSAKDDGVWIFLAVKGWGVVEISEIEI